MKRAAGYIRISTTDQTLDGQAAELAAYCESRGWTLELFQDVETGAAAGRPGLAKMMEALKRGQAETC
ncbi:MAG: recombinase family protein [Opitutaceae bacterium]